MIPVTGFLPGKIDLRGPGTFSLNIPGEIFGVFKVAHP